MRLSSLLLDLPKISPVHLARYPNPRLQLLGGSRPINHGFYVANHDRKVSRTWKLNTQIKIYRSEMLNEDFRLLVTARVMRTIDKKGGFDNYLLDTNEKHLGSKEAMEIKNKLLAAILQKQKSQFFGTSLLAASPTSPSSSSAIVSPIAAAAAVAGFKTTAAARGQPRA